MKNVVRASFVAAFALIACSVVAPEKRVASNASALKQVAAIQLPDVKGRIDHLAYASGRLFVAELGIDTVEVLDVRAGKRSYLVEDLHEPQGVAYVSGSEGPYLAIANGTSGQLSLVDLTFFNGQADHLAIGDDADNVRLEPRSKSLIVGYGAGGLAIVDRRGSPDAWDVSARIPLDAHPESFQIDSAEKLCWVNLPGSQSIAVVDLAEKKVVRKIHVDAAKQNYPMALDEAQKRLIVGCRDPGKLLVFDIETDKLLDALPLSPDVDDVFIDDELGRIYASCGEGLVDVFERSGPSAWKPKEKIATAPGARTCLFVPEEKKLFVAVPRRGARLAEIRVFETVR